jgi:hypothetical protein
MCAFLHGTVTRLPSLSQSTLIPVVCLLSHNRSPLIATQRSSCIIGVVHPATERREYVSNRRYRFSSIPHSRHSTFLDPHSSLPCLSFLAELLKNATDELLN